MGSGYRAPSVLPDSTGPVAPVVCVDVDDDGGLGELLRVFPATGGDHEPCHITPWPSVVPLSAGTGIAPETKGSFDITAVVHLGDAPGDAGVTRVHGHNTAVASGTYDVAVFSVDTLYVREMNYHPCGEQLFYVGTPPGLEMHFGLLLAPPGPSPNPVFVVAPAGCGVAVRANVWHQPPVPLHRMKPWGGLRMTTRQSSVHACVDHDFGANPARVFL